MSNHYVITGNPGSGKNTLLKALRRRGVSVRFEVARQYIEEQIELGKNIEEIRSNEQSFQTEVLKRKVEREHHLDPQEVVFLDRGIPDTYAYLKGHGFNISG